MVVFVAVNLEHLTAFCIVTVLERYLDAWPGEVLAVVLL